MSKTSLNRFKNPELIKEYWLDNWTRCEVSGFIPAEDRKEVRRLAGPIQLNKLELHHILRQPHYKVDNWSNVIIIDSVTHRPWGHDKHPNELTVVCLYAKWRKAEFDIHELNTAGPKTVRGEISNLKYKLEHKPAYVDMCEQMLATIPE